MLNVFAVKTDKSNTKCAACFYCLDFKVTVYCSSSENKVLNITGCIFVHFSLVAVRQEDSLSHNMFHNSGHKLHIYKRSSKTKLRPRLIWNRIRKNWTCVFKGTTPRITRSLSDWDTVYDEGRVFKNTDAFSTQRSPENLTKCESLEAAYASLYHTARLSGLTFWGHETGFKTLKPDKSDL